MLYLQKNKLWFVFWYHFFNAAAKVKPAKGKIGLPFLETESNERNTKAKYFIFKLLQLNFEKCNVKNSSP